MQSCRAAASPVYGLQPRCAAVHRAGAAAFVHPKNVDTAAFSTGIGNHCFATSKRAARSVQPHQQWLCSTVRVSQCCSRTTTMLVTISHVCCNHSSLLFVFFHLQGNCFVACDGLQCACGALATLPCSSCRVCTMSVADRTHQRLHCSVTCASSTCSRSGTAANVALLLRCRLGAAHQQQGLVFTYWQKRTQRTKRQCTKALDMHQQRVYAVCFHALLQSAQHHKQNRQRLQAAAQLFQRRTWRLCQAILSQWRNAVTANKACSEQAAAMFKMQLNNTLRGTMQLWYESDLSNALKSFPCQQIVSMHCFRASPPALPAACYSGTERQCMSTRPTAMLCTIDVHLVAGTTQRSAASCAREPWAPCMTCSG